MEEMQFLKRAHATWDVIEKLIREEKMVELTYRGETFYMRKIHASPHG